VSVDVGEAGVLVGKAVAVGSSVISMIGPTNGSSVEVSAGNSAVCSAVASAVDSVVGSTIGFIVILSLCRAKARLSGGVNKLTEIKTSPARIMPPPSLREIPACVFIPVYLTV
jgi:hypothetical protein